MLQLRQTIFSVLRDESGQDLIEYALVACFVGLGIVASTHTLATGIRGVFNNIGTVLTSAT